MNGSGAARQGGRHARCAFLGAIVVVLTTGCLAALGAGSTVAAAATATPPRHGLAATYFDDAGLKRAKVQRIDPRIHFVWGAKSPSRAIAANTFSARWTGSLDVPRTGRYAFTARASDGARVWIDGRLRLNGWTRAAKPRDRTTALRLARGKHAIRVEYYEHTGIASMSLLWSGPGIKRQVIPTARLVPPPAPSPTPPRTPTATDPAVGAKPWSDPATWGGSVPADGSAVTIPAGTTVLLDRDVSLANLTIDGALVFARRDLTVETDWILVHGALHVGTEAAPFTQRAVIRLRDLTPGENVMNMGDKVVAVMGGTLELHGPKRVAYTKLAASAAKGADRISLAAAPDWRVGDRIAIASTDFNRAQAQETTITAVDGKVVTLDKPLEYSHFGELQTVAGRQVDERAEVALLTRGVTVEGEATSSAGGFGAQVMVMGEATVHVEGAELSRVGQAGLLRRYPIHFHMLGDGGARSYVRDSSIHHSNNRCLTIHGTNQVMVTGNVCFDHRGHGIFLEDGAERGNTIAGNLVFGSRRPDDGKRLLASDETPASFWITNPDNVVRGNTAAGSDGPGFWIALPEHPTGLFATMFPEQTKAIWNRRTALGEFSGNTAHSNGGDGLNFDNGPNADGTTGATHHHAYADPTDTKSRTVVTDMTGLTAWKNRGHGAWLRGTEHRLTGALLADNGIGATFASDESVLRDSLVVGETANVGTPEPWEVRSGGVGRGGRSAPMPWDADFPIRGFEFYDGRVGVERTTFANFQPWQTASGERREQSGLGYKLDNDFGVHPRNFATAVQFVNARRLYMQDPAVGFDGSISSVFLDTDGSVTGTAGRSVTMNNPFLLGVGCEARSEWNAQVCTGDYASLMIGAPGNHGALAPATITRGDGAVQTVMASTSDDADDASTTVLANAAYRVAFNGGTPARTRFVLQRGSDRWVRVSFPRAQGFKVLRYGCEVARAGSWCFGAAGSSAALDALDRSGYWYDDGGDADPATGTLHLKVHAGDADWSELTVE